MNATVRKQLRESRNSELSLEKRRKTLRCAFALLKSTAESRSLGPNLETMSFDLLVLCAESALDLQEPEVAGESLDLFFLASPPHTQFLARAYLCQAQLYAPSSSDHPEDLDKAVLHLVKAINFCRDVSQYHFLVYNASVVFWEMARPFLKPKHKQFLANHLQQIVKALDDVEDQDFEWRSTLMVQLIECLLDGGRFVHAATAAAQAASFVKANNPSMFKTVFGLQVRHHLADHAVLQRSVESSPELSAFFRMCSLKMNLESRDPAKPVVDVHNEIGIVLKIFKGEDLEEAQSQTSEEAPNGADEAPKEEVDEGENVEDDEPMSPVPDAQEHRPELLLELARFCIEVNEIEFAQEAVRLLQECEEKPESVRLESEFVVADLMIRLLDGSRDSYSVASVENRINALMRAQAALNAALRLRLPGVIQVGCATIWNICLPLLQPNLRHHVRKPLIAVAEALENIKSLMLLLRCQVHMEVAKCEEDQDQLYSAIQHLDKAVGLDDSGIYRERIETARHRIKLRGELYKVPRRLEDQAGMIIEQAKKAATGSVEAMRALLIKAGEALSPDAFIQVLDAENESIIESTEAYKGTMTSLMKKGAKARHFNASIPKVDGHLRRIGDTNDRERARLWGDLAKVARKLEVWDVCRTSSRFCLAYDDDRFKAAAFDEVLESPGRGGLSTSSNAGDSVPESLDRKSKARTSSAAAVVERGPGGAGIYERDLVRMMAEVNFVNSEAVIQLLRSEGVELNDLPQSPPEAKRRSKLLIAGTKGQPPKKAEEDIDWLDYVDWLKGLSRTATDGFVRAINIGKELNESWIICSAAAYLWNYHHHIFTAFRNKEIIEILQVALEGLKFVGSDGDVVLLTNVCNALAFGLISPWIPPRDTRDLIVEYGAHGHARPATGGGPPKSPKKPKSSMANKKKGKKGKSKNARWSSSSSSESSFEDFNNSSRYTGFGQSVLSNVDDFNWSAKKAPAGKKGGKKTPGKKDAKAKGKQKPTGVQISPEGAADIKKALEVLDFAVESTKGTNSSNSIHVAYRHPLLKTWVLTKQMSQQQIGKSLGCENETSNEGQNPLTRALVAVEMLHLNNNGIMEFTSAPTIAETIELVDKCSWPDQLVQLETWTRLANVAFEDRNHELVVRCSNSALAFAAAEHRKSNTAKRDASKLKLEKELLCYASCILGQSLVDTMMGKNSIRKQAMEAFISSAQYARDAKSYDLVMTATRHYWNTCLPLVSDPSERMFLLEQLRLLLQCIGATASKLKDVEEKAEGAKDTTAKAEAAAAADKTGDKDDKHPLEKSKEASKDAAGKDGAGAAPGTGSRAATPREEPVKPAPTITVSDDLALRAAIYGVLFQAYADRGDHEGALAAMEEAVHSMPRTKHRLHIFKHRIMIKAKLGMDVSMDIARFKEEPEEVLAAIWRKVALASKDQKEQLSAYQQCITSLGNKENMWQKFDYLLEFAIWLYENEFANQDVIDVIEWAADLLVDMKSEKKKEKRRKKKTGGTPKTSQEGASKSILKRTGSHGSRGADGAAADANAATATTAAAGAAADRTSPPRADVAELASSDSSSSSDVGQGFSIGLPPKSDSLDVKDFSDIRQLEGLFRTHVMLAIVKGESTMDYKDTLLVAHALLLRLWSVAMTTASPIMKELAKNPPPAEGDDPSGKGSPKLKGKKEKGQEQSQSEKKPKRKVALDALPATVEDWAFYDVPDEALEAWKTEAVIMQGINTKSMTKPILTFYYVDELATKLERAGFPHLSLSLFAFNEMLAKHIIGSHTLDVLVHLKAAEICTRLNLPTAATFHEKFCVDPLLNSQEQANSRDSIKAHLDALLAKEANVEERREKLTELIKQAEMESAKYARSKKSRPGTTAAKKAAALVAEATALANQSTIVNRPVLKQRLSRVEYRDAWLESAKVLVRQGRLVTARSMLNEALLSAKAFKATDVMAKVYLELGKISYAEANYTQSLNFLIDAYKYDGDEEFWFDSATLLIDATLQERAIKDNVARCRNIHAHVARVYSDLRLQRPNKIPLFEKSVVALEAKMVTVDEEQLVARDPDLKSGETVNGLKEICTKYERVGEKLLAMRDFQEAYRTFEKQALVMHRVARAKSLQFVTTEEEMRAYFIDSLCVMGRAMTIAEAFYQNVTSSSDAYELNGVSLPVQRELVRILLGYAAILTAMFEIFIEDERARRNVEARKNSVERLVEEFVYQEPVLTGIQKDWRAITSKLPEAILAKLEAAYILGAGIPKLRARTLCSLGRCLRLLSIHTAPDPPAQWSAVDAAMTTAPTTPLVQSASRASAAPLSGAGEDKKDSMAVEDAKALAKLAKQATAVNNAFNESNTMLMQASEYLSQALNLSLSKGLPEEAADASMDLMECCGTFDPIAAAQFLALHQSCLASLKLRATFHESQRDPALSRQAAMLQTRSLLLRDDARTNNSKSSTIKVLTSKLEEESQAWKVLSVSQQHLDLLKEFPQNFSMLLLQHSPCKRFLYSALLERPRGTGGPGTKGNPPPKTAQPQMINRSRAVRVSVYFKEVEDLVAAMEKFKLQVNELLLRQEYQRQGQANWEKLMEQSQSAIPMQQQQDMQQANGVMMDGLIDGGGGEEASSASGEDFAAEEAELQEEFQRIANGIDEYLKPVFANFDLILRPPSASTQHQTLSANRNKSPAKKKGTTSNPKDKGEQVPAAGNECIVILADDVLMQLPLEASPCLQAEHINSLTRDFSLQILQHRIHQEADAEGDEGKRAKEKAKLPSRILQARDMSKRNVKIIPVERQPPPWCQSFDTHGFRYIVDPYTDCDVTDPTSPIEVFEQLLNKYVQQYTPRWMGIMGNERVPSMGEWELAFNEALGVIFYGMERVVSYLPPEKLSNLNLPDCYLVMLADLAQTTKSFLRQSLIDIKKLPSALALEKPLPSIEILTLCGVKCVMANQWHCTLEENKVKINVTMKDLLEQGKTTGQTTRMLFTPYRRKDDEPDDDGGGGADGSNKGGGAESEAGKDVAKLPGQASLEKEEGADNLSVADGGDDPHSSLPSAAGSHKPGSSAGKAADEEHEAEFVLHRNWFNMVCYGLPNLMVA